MTDWTRRGFLGAVGGLIPVGAAACAPVHHRTFPDEVDPEGVHLYGRYACRWTGWKGSVESDWRVGQWLGWPLAGMGQPDFPDREPYLYVNVPGFVGGVYLPGAVFNLSSYGRVVDPTTPRAKADRWLLQGVNYLHQLITQYQGTPMRDLQGWPSRVFGDPKDR